MATQNVCSYERSYMNLNSPLSVITSDTTFRLKKKTIVVSDDSMKNCHA